MKKSNNLVIVAFVAFALTLSSCKKGDEPTPTPAPVSQNNGGTNTAPTVTIPAPTADANGTTITVSATDTDGIQSVTINQTQPSVGSTTTLTAPYSYPTGALANGTYTYSVKVTDATGMITNRDVTFTVSNAVVTPSAKTITETNLSGFLDRALSKVGGNGPYIGTLLITPTTMSSPSQAQATFFNGLASGTYNVNTSGYLILTTGTIQTTYSVSTGTKNSNPTLILTNTNVNNASELYIFQ